MPFPPVYNGSLDDPHGGQFRKNTLNKMYSQASSRILVLWLKLIVNLDKQTHRDAP